MKFSINPIQRNCSIKYQGLFQSAATWRTAAADVPIGCYDRAEICELVGIFILNKLSNITDKNSIGLYSAWQVIWATNRTDEKENYQNFQRLRSFNNGSNKHYICRLSRFNIKFENESYQLSRKPNNDPIYIDINSNHPPQTLKQLPKSISKRLSENSLSKEVFDESKALYKKSLNNTSFYESLIYHQKQKKINIKR